MFAPIAALKYVRPAWQSCQITHGPVAYVRECAAPVPFQLW
jgi:hypothetical protein